MLLAKWIEALRSGKYRQTQRVLRRVEEDGSCSMCVLGVLCEVSGMGEWEGSCSLQRYVVKGGAGTSYLLPPFPVVDAVGVGRKIEDTLTNMNDGNGPWEGNPQSFEQIADYLEELLPKQQSLPTEPEREQ
jgi:hypothetical protein